MSSIPIESFCRITRTDSQNASVYLKENNEDLRSALVDFYRMERSTHVNATELKRARIEFKMPVASSLRLDSSFANVALVEKLHSVIQISRKTPFTSILGNDLTSKVRIAIFLSALTHSESFFQVAKKFHVPRLLVMPIVLEVSKAVNAAFQLPGLSKSKLQEVAKEFEEQTFIPRIVGALTSWKGLVLFCDPNQEIFAAEPQNARWLMRGVEESASEFVPDPAPLSPSSKDKIGFRFVSGSQSSRHSLLYLPYFIAWNHTLSKLEVCFNTAVTRITDATDLISLQLNAIFPFKIDQIPEDRLDEIRLTCLHLFNLMKRTPKLMECYKVQPQLMSLPSRYYWPEKCKDAERDRIAEFMYERANKRRTVFVFE